MDAGHTGRGTVRENRMKAKLISNEPVFGVSVMIPSPQIVEMVGRLGFDWVLIDCLESLPADLRLGVRYFYTHVTTLLASSGRAYLRVANGRAV